MAAPSRTCIGRLARPIVHHVALLAPDAQVTRMGRAGQERERAAVRRLPPPKELLSIRRGVKARLRLRPVGYDFGRNLALLPGERRVCSGGPNMLGVVSESCTTVVISLNQMQEGPASQCRCSRSWLPDTMHFQTAIGSFNRARSWRSSRPSCVLHQPHIRHLHKTTAPNRPQLVPTADAG